MKLKTRKIITIISHTINGLESLASQPSPTSGCGARVPGLVLLLLDALLDVPLVLGVLLGLDVLGEVGREVLPPGLELANR